MGGMKRLLAAMLALTLSACTWVELTPQGEDVRVLDAEQVAGCKRVGKTTVRTADTVAGLARHEEKIQSELETLARNSALDIGGDTVVALGQQEQGVQDFAVFRCIPQP